MNQPPVMKKASLIIPWTIKHTMKPSTIKHTMDHQPSLVAAHSPPRGAGPDAESCWRPSVLEQIGGTVQTDGRGNPGRPRCTTVEEVLPMVTGGSTVVNGGSTVVNGWWMMFFLGDGSTVVNDDWTMVKPWLMMVDDYEFFLATGNGGVAGDLCFSGWWLRMSHGGDFDDGCW